MAEMTVEVSYLDSERVLYIDHAFYVPRVGDRVTFPSGNTGKVEHVTWVIDRPGMTSVVGAKVECFVVMEPG